VLNLAVTASLSPSTKSLISR